MKWGWSRAASPTSNSGQIIAESASIAPAAFNSPRNNMEPFLTCPLIVLFLGGFLSILSLASLLNIYPIMTLAEENRRLSFILTLIGVALMMVSRL